MISATGQTQKSLEAAARAAFKGNQLMPREAALRAWLAAGLELHKLDAICKKASQGRGLMDRLPERVSVELLKSGALSWWASEWATFEVLTFKTVAGFELSGGNKKGLTPLGRTLVLAACVPGVSRSREKSAKLCLAHGAWARDQVKQAWPILMDALDAYAQLRGFNEGKAAWHYVEEALRNWKRLGVDPTLMSQARIRAEQACTNGRALGEWKRAACHAIGEDSVCVLQAVRAGSAQAGVDIDVSSEGAGAGPEAKGWLLLARAAKAQALDCFKVLMAAEARSAWIRSDGSVGGVAEVLKALAARAASRPEMGELFLSFSMVAAAKLRALGMSANLAAQAVEHAGSKAFPAGGTARARSVREEITLRQSMALAADAKTTMACAAGVPSGEGQAKKKAPRL